MRLSRIEHSDGRALGRPCHCVRHAQPPGGRRRNLVRCCMLGEPLLRIIYSMQNQSTISKEEAAALPPPLDHSMPSMPISANRPPQFHQCCNCQQNVWAQYMDDCAFCGKDNCSECTELCDICDDIVCLGCIFIWSTPNMPHSKDVGICLKCYYVSINLQVG